MFNRQFSRQSSTVQATDFTARPKRWIAIGCCLLTACTLADQPVTVPPPAVIPPMPPPVTQSSVAAPRSFSSNFAWSSSAATPTPRLSDSDAPSSFVKEGEDFYEVHSNGNGTWKVFKGTSLEEMTQSAEFYTFDAVGKANGFTQPHGDDVYWTSGGIWVDPSGTWYTTVHIEFNYAGSNYAFPHFRRIGYATTTNHGATWQFKADILTSDNPTDSKDDFPGSYFDFGVGDQQLYVDTVGGYFYVNYEKTWFDKKNLKRFEGTAIARCPIRAAMAPGCWKQWFKGGWTEPGLGGHASLVLPNVAVGGIFYSTYLNRFVYIGMISDDGSKSTAVITTASSLETQDWTPLDHFGTVDNFDTFPESLQFYLTAMNPISGGRVVGQSVRLLYSASNAVLGATNSRTITFAPGATVAYRAPTQRYPAESVTNGDDLWQWDLNPDGDINLALHKPASQSSTAWNSSVFSADKAVDGNVSSDLQWGSVTQTEPDGETNPWWQVDLGSVQAIGKIKIYNRTDCCPTLTNFRVFVSDTPFGSTNLPATTAQSGVSTFAVDGESRTVTLVNANRTARFVRVQLGSAQSLSLSEVQVLSPKNR